MSDVRRVENNDRGAAKRPASIATAQKTAKRSASVLQSSYADDSIIAKVITVLCEQAAKNEATALHIDPQESGLVIRERLDGRLREVKKITQREMPALVARVKMLANLDVTETRVPQEGTFAFTGNDSRYIVRVSIVPVADGEKVVLQFADQNAQVSSLEELGYWGNSLQAMHAAINDARGLVVVTGPHDSAVERTLYALVGQAVDDSISVATVEDDITQRIAKVYQTAVNTKVGMTFPATLRAVLRQDPQVVMVGDVREPDTARQITQAALAGRMVCAGMATPDAAAALNYLRALEVESYVLATSMLSIANQRFPRMLCTSCREQYAVNKDEFSAACSACGLSAHEIIPHLQQLAALYRKAQVPSIEGRSFRLWRASERGCAACGGTGYKGRVMIAEVISVSPAIQKLIFSNASPLALYDQAIIEGTIPLPLDGLVRVLHGDTSLEEILRVVSIR